MAYTEALLDAICERVLSGESLRSICEEAGMPDVATASRLLEFQADLYMDEMMDLVDGAEASAKIEAIKRRVDALLDAVPPEYARE